MGEQRYSYDVFVSSGEADTLAARETVALLRRGGLRVWHQDDAGGGGHIGYYATEALKGARVLVLLLSPATIRSGWQALEAQTFSFRDPSSKDRQLVLLGLDAFELPASLAQAPVIDWRATGRGEAAARLIAICTPPPEKPTARGLNIPRSDAGRLHSINLTLVSCATFISGHRGVAFGTHDGQIRIASIDAPSKALHGVTGHTGPVTALGADASAGLLYSTSLDRSIKSWHLESGELRGEIRDAGGPVTALHIDGTYILAGLRDGQIKVWQQLGNEVPRTLRGHAGQVHAITARGTQIVSASEDSTIRVWNRSTGQCIRVLEGHVGPVLCLAVSPDGRYLASGSADRTVGLWDLSSGQNLNSFDSHTDGVRTCAWHAGGRLLVSAGGDRSPRVWDVDTGRLLRILDGNEGDALFSAFEEDAVWTSDSHKLCRWDIAATLSTDASPAAKGVAPSPSQQVQYTNAKVLLVGDSGAGKTGLSKRLACGDWEPSAASTVGAWATQWALPANKDEHGDREIWLWDFGGQADQRLIHQLYMDETALAVLVFDAQRPHVFEALSQWDQDLRRSDATIARLLVAGRIDASPVRTSRSDIDSYVVENGFKGYLETSALTNQGCDDLRDAIVAAIDWHNIPWRSSPALFKRLKEEVVKLKDEGRILMRRNELRDTLRLRLPTTQINFTDAELKAVLSLLSGPGVVTELEFGAWVLFQPELINAYGQAVISTMRQDPGEMGCISEQRVLSGDLEYGNFKRIPAEDEPFVLLEMHRKLLQRGLCARELTEKDVLLVFPSYYKRNRPALTGHPAVIMSYIFDGVVDEIYATLVVRLDHTKVFRRARLWQDAAEFSTNSEAKVGVKLSRSAFGTPPSIEIYCEPHTLLADKILFTRCVHEHLNGRASNVTRRRHYVCGECSQPVADLRAVEHRMQAGRVDIGCAVCDARVPLVDELELQFAAPEVIRQARQLEEKASVELDNESKERALVGEVISTVALAQQLSREKTVSDHGIDMEIEFKDDAGHASGQMLFLQLKSGDSYLRIRGDGKEYFAIRDQRHVDYWMNQIAPVMLVVRSSNGEIRWMEIRKYLRDHTKGDKKVTRIEFQGERFDTQSIMKWRNHLFSNTKSSRSGSRSQ